jgi:hypothetical protein
MELFCHAGKAALHCVAAIRCASGLSALPEVATDRDRGSFDERAGTE